MSDSPTPPKFPLSSMDVAEEKRRQLKQLFPEAFTEARDAKTGELKHAVDWEKLRASLGEVLEREGERFGLSWPGKSALLKVIQQPSVGTLKPCREESVKFDETENLFIEGDNLEVLKLLQKSYFGKVKMIYIDPPYNTGNEFVYPDNFTESLETYLQYTGMVDAQGRKFSTNAATEGRFHSKWLNMMYPRLFLAKNLLVEEGLIFISMDESELANLQKLCDEIFGDENHLATFIWEKRTNRENRKLVSYRHDYVICYCRAKREDGERTLRQLPMSEKALANYRNPDNDPRGDWKSDPAHAQAGHGTKSQFYDLTAPNGKIHKLESGRCWVYTETEMMNAIADGRIWFGQDGNGVPRIKTYLNAKERGLTPESIFFAKEASTNEGAKNDLKELFDGAAVFETPKPVALIKTILKMSDSDGLILDFFSGSCATADAVIKVNEEDGGNRKFIMVQLPEPCDEKSEAFKAGYKTIADIGKERIRRVIQKIEIEQDGQLDFDKGGKTQDLGFKVFKLSESNFKLWEGDETDPAKLKEQLEMHINHLDPKATPEDILHELLLKAGFPLTTKVEKISISNKSAYSIAEGALIICLDDDLTKEAIQAIAALKPVQCICLDAAFHENDQLKTNAVQTMESAKVQFRTV